MPWACKHHPRPARQVTTDPLPRRHPPAGSHRRRRRGAAGQAGVALAAGLWAWRRYAIMAGIAGRMASAPVTFDARQWNREAAEGRSNAQMIFVATIG
jgi:hypothetical protein